MVLLLTDSMPQDLPEIGWTEHTRVQKKIVTDFSRVISTLRLRWMSTEFDPLYL